MTDLAIWTGNSIHSNDFKCILWCLELEMKDLQPFATTDSCVSYTMCKGNSLFLLLKRTKEFSKVYQADTVTDVCM